MSKNQKLELTWILKENRPKLEPLVLLEEPENSYHAKYRPKGDGSRGAAENAEKYANSPNPNSIGTSETSCGFLNQVPQQGQAEIKRTISGCHARFFEAAAEKLQGWANDLKPGVKHKIEEVRRAATTALTLEEKLADQKQIKPFESQCSEKPCSRFNAKDKVDQQRAELIASIERKLLQQLSKQAIFTIK